MISRFFLLYFFLFFLTSCATFIHQEKDFSQPPEAVSVMAYNMENLFDEKHDPGTRDYSYLPLEKKQNQKHKKRCSQIKYSKYRRECLELDWSKEVIHTKLSRLAEVVQQVNNGRGPDILIVEEVENKSILKRFADKYLPNAGYKTVVLIEGFDKRGIDVGFLSRFPLIKKAQLHKIPFKGIHKDDQKWMDRSRGILQGDFRLPDGEILTVFGVHFPSPSNPTYWRRQAIAYLNSLMKNLPKDRLAIAGGDFNIASREERKSQLYEKHLGSKWLVSHLIGCQHCRGTNYYHSKREWSFLDALIFKNNFHPKKGNGGWYVDPASIQVANTEATQTNRWLSPARFDEDRPTGVSDHWPIYARILPRNKGKKP